MKVSKEDEVWLCNGSPKQRRFKYCIERSMTVEISDWLQQTFKGGYGVDYYYSHGEIWFMKGRHETLFLLRWSA
jgi:hypothetical protein